MPDRDDDNVPTDISESSSSDAQASDETSETVFCGFEIAKNEEDGPSDTDYIEQNEPGATESQKGFGVTPNVHRSNRVTKHIPPNRTILSRSIVSSDQSMKH